MKKFFSCVLIVTVSFFVVSCASNVLSEKGKKVEVITKAQDGCTAVGKIVGKHKDGILELAKNMARNEAADLGANSIVFNEEITNGKERVVNATAYICE